MNRHGITVLLSVIMTFAGYAPATAQDLDAPHPPVVTSNSGAPPSDAIVLFDGADLSRWTTTNGGPVDWKIADGAMTVGRQSIITKQEFQDVQLHIEWATPAEVVGDGQGRGNSGIKFMTQYEVQVLDSYNNTDTYANGTAASVYLQHAPLVNASRKPGEWQVYEIIFHAPRFDAQGATITKGTVTVLHNGVLVQDHVELQGATGARPRERKVERAPLLLQNHRNPVRFRNIWIREL